MEFLSSNSLSLAILAQAAVLAYGYGRLVQKVENLCRRMDKIESGRNCEGADGATSVDSGGAN